MDALESRVPICVLTAQYLGTTLFPPHKHVLVPLCTCKYTLVDSRYWDARFPGQFPWTTMPLALSST